MKLPHNELHFRKGFFLVSRRHGVAGQKNSVEAEPHLALGSFHEHGEHGLGCILGRPQHDDRPGGIALHGPVRAEKENIVLSENVPGDPEFGTRRCIVFRTRVDVLDRDDRECKRGEALGEPGCFHGVF